MNLVELEMIDFDIILAWISNNHVKPQSIVDIGLFDFSIQIIQS